MTTPFFQLMRYEDGMLKEMYDYLDEERARSEYGG